MYEYIKPTVLFVFFGVIAETWILKQNKSSIVKPGLEFASVSLTVTHKTRIECIQNKFIRFL